jgi:hypothetical protein
MKHIILKNAITSNLTIKICSIIVGYCLWVFLSQYQIADITLSIPLYIYGSCENKIIEAPENVVVTLAKRSDFYLLDTKSLAIHLNADNLPIGTKELLIKEKHLFLPKAVSMVHCSPRIVNVTTSNT